MKSNLKRKDLLLLTLLLTQTTSIWAMESEDISPIDRLANTQHYQVVLGEDALMASQEPEASKQPSKEIETGTKPELSRYCVNKSSYTFLLEESSYQNQILGGSSSESDSSSSDDDSSANDKNCEDNPYFYSSDFNDIINELCNFYLNNKGKLLDAHSQWEKLHTIGDSFVNKAITYGRVIIQERGQSLTGKTIRPVDLGGVAGGDKYIAQGILFKFAKDRNVYDNTWLYGGNKPDEYLAAKSAGQELLSANYVGSHSPLIKVPLMAIVDYWGHRLIAMALLPIDKDTLVYGSGDAGATVLSTDPIVSQEMDALGKNLNLQQHNVGSTLMALCGDLEVHLCNFNTSKNNTTQYYCLDTARVFPPEFNRNTKKIQSIFYEKLRPEFVKQYKTPLSSDSLTGFQEKDLENTKYNRAVLEATEYLHQVIFPDYIKELTKQEIIEEILSTTSLYYTLRWSNRDYVPNALVYHMHQHGINLRHLGKIITLLETLDPENADCSPEMLSRLKKYVHNVMITRVIKNHVRKQVSEKAKEEKEYRETLLNIMNFLTCEHPESEQFWQETVPNLLKSKFEISADPIAKNLQQGFLLLNFCQLSGIVLHPVCFDKFSKQYNSQMNFKFGSSDIIEIRPTIKYLNYIDLATGIYSLLLSEKNKEENSRISTDFLQKAYDRLLSPLSTWSNLTHPILPENFTTTVSQMKERIIQTKIQTKGQTLIVQDKDPNLLQRPYFLKRPQHLPLPIGSNTEPVLPENQEDRCVSEFTEKAWDPIQETEDPIQKKVKHPRRRKFSKKQVQDKEQELPVRPLLPSPGSQQLLLRVGNREPVLPNGVSPTTAATWDSTPKKRLAIEDRKVLREKEALERQEAILQILENLSLKLMLSTPQEFTVFKRILKINNNLLNLTSLNLEKNNIGAEGVKALSTGNFTNLTYLNLDSNTIGDEGAIPLSIGNLLNLTSLNLEKNNIGAEGSKALSTGNLTNLTYLNLDSNTIGNRGVQALSTGNLFALKTLLLSRNSTRYECKIDNEGVKALSAGNLINLTSLNLGYNSITDAGVIALANGNLINLKSLNLMEVIIEDEGAKAIANGKLSSLTSLYFSRNRIGNEGKIAFEKRKDLKLEITPW